LLHTPREEAAEASEQALLLTHLPYRLLLLLLLPLCCPTRSLQQQYCRQHHCYPHLHGLLLHCLLQHCLLLNCLLLHYLLPHCLQLWSLQSALESPTTQAPDLLATAHSHTSCHCWQCCCRALLQRAWLWRLRSLQQRLRMGLLCSSAMLRL
jgi:hypothetical protein